MEDAQDSLRERIHSQVNPQSALVQLVSSLTFESWWTAAGFSGTMTRDFALRFQRTDEPGRLQDDAQL